MPVSPFGPEATVRPLYQDLRVSALVPQLVGGIDGGCNRRLLRAVWAVMFTVVTDLPFTAVVDDDVLNSSHSSAFLETIAGMTTVTLPPELLPSPADGEEVEIIVIHPDTRRAETFLLVTGDDMRPVPPDCSPYVPSRGSRSIQ